jgi:multidrug efflux pump subunit AcrB
MPPGITPPLIVHYSASNVPILQLGVSLKTLSEQQLYDYGQNFIRTQLATIRGAAVPLPYGGKPRQIMVDLDIPTLQAKGLAAIDVTSAINAQNLILPAGTAKMGEREYSVRLNSSSEAVELLNDLPIRQVIGATVYIRDVAQVHDGFAVQTNIVHLDGRRASVISLLKSGGASTLDVVNRLKEAMPRIQATLPSELDLRFLFDQSLFVRAAVDGVITEAAIAACLTALMSLLFLGSWRSTLIVAISIPLSILCSIVVRSFAGQTLNVMTLGGLALAVGILVDDATVEIENIHRHLGQGKPLIRAILDGAQQIATPAFVSTLSICIVFVSVVFLTGAVQSLFTPLAMAVVVAMMASYLLSRTLIPTLVRSLLHSEVQMYQHVDGDHGADRIASSGRCITGSIGDLNGFAAITATPSPGRYSAEPWSWGWQSRFLGVRWCWCYLSGKTFSRGSMRGSFGCMSERLPGRASKRQSGCSARSRTSFAAPFPLRNFPSFWTTSAYRWAASIWLSATAPRSAPQTVRFSSRSIRSITARPGNMSKHYAHSSTRSSLT